MKIAIFGGTGFIGSTWMKQWIHEGGEVFLVTRRPDQIPITTRSLVTVCPLPLQQRLTVDGVINLAGETINQRWTRAAKTRILESRIHTTQHIVEAIVQGQLKTEVLINGSAVGYYGHSMDHSFTELDEDQRMKDDFLGHVTEVWEKEAAKVIEAGVRLVKARFGVVLGHTGGALSRMVLPYRMFVGGPIGQGNQWVSWIHVDDAVQLLNFCLHQKEVQGPVNFTAPQPSTMDQLGKTIAKVIKRPHWFPLPAFMGKALLGEMSDLILKGQRVIPTMALEHGFSFQYPNLELALRQILQHEEK